ncbi:MAG TPA: hypothetical protein VFU05_11570 [Cyclobacteriaceae bacterium]|nr:hypothetical protein [Cyclobacteriaceae bacterium]
MTLRMRRGFKSYRICISAVVFSLLTLTNTHAQEVKVTAGFMKDSVQIGEPVGYYLAASYPQSLNVLFPDSTFNFAPFEFNRKIYLPTATSNGISYDSAVYYLSTFEIDSIQYLDLPVFIANTRDCTSYTPLKDSIALIQAIKNPPDSVEAQKLPLKTNTLYEIVFSQFNYIILIIVGGVLLIVTIVGWAFFGKKIIQYFKVRELKKKYNKFITEFTAQLNQLTEAFSPELAEQTVLTWKKYMEGLSKIPYTKYTTPEIKKAFADHAVGHSLATIDRMTYGGIRPDSFESFKQLKSEAEISFQKKITESEEPALKTLSTEDGSKVIVAQQDGKAPAQYTVEDIYNYADLIRQLPCPVCQRTTQPLNGTILYTVKSFVILTYSRRKPIIACPDCLNKKNNLAIVTTALLGWWGFPWGLINSPQYIYKNVMAKKHNKTRQPNEVLLSLTLQHINEIEVNKNNPDKLKEVIKSKKSWWLP